MAGKNTVFGQLNKLTTEKRNPASKNIDIKSVSGILKIINDEDKKIAVSVRKELLYIEQAVNLVVAAFRKGGRLIYVGAGTSGRLGVLDAVECPPTFGTKHEMVQGIIAGGEKAMFRAQEGVEDKEENGAGEIDRKKVSKNDVICGIAASLRTPFVVGAVKRAKQLGARTIYISTNPRVIFKLPEFKDIESIADISICPDVGPEVIMGSTRMKSGTAQKLVLNMITTAAMIRLGKVYENMMIDLQMTNQKLRERAKRIVMTITGVTYAEAVKYLSESDFHVKTAIVMIKAGVTLGEAEVRLKRADGFVRAAIEGREYRIL